MTALRLGNVRILNKLVICFAAIIAAALASSAWIYHQRNTLADAESWTEHSYQVLDALYNAMEGTFLEQGALRGYVITGNPAVLDNYRTGRKEFENSIAKIGELTADNAAQQRRVAKIDKTVGQFADNVIEPTIKLMADPATRDQGINFVRTPSPSTTSPISAMRRGPSRTPSASCWPSAR